MDDDCTIYKTADFIGKRWTLVIILALYKGNGTKRYTELKREISGITSKILSLRLKELEKQGLVKKRIDTSTVPISCYYSLSKIGADFIGIIKDMKSWALKWNIDNRVCSMSNCKNCKL